MTSTVIELGYIAGAHGVHGELKLKLFNSSSNLLHEHTTLHLKTSKGELHELTVRSWREAPKHFLVRFQSIGNRHQAEALRGSKIIMELPETTDDDEEFYLESLRGYEVEDTVHGIIGVITGFMMTNLDILVVRGTNGDETLIPMLENTLRDVQVKEKRVIVQTPEGLIEG